MFRKSVATHMVLFPCLCVFAVITCAEDAAHLRFSLEGKDADTTYTVTASGRVLDKATEQPIPDARVRGHILVWGAGDLKSDNFDRCPFMETKTNANGEYQLTFETRLTGSGPMKGKDLLGVDAGAPGYETRPINVKNHVTPRQTNYTQLDIKLEKGKAVKGVLLDDGGKPVSGAIVSVQSGLNGDWSFFHSLGGATTDQNGHFQFNCTTDENLVAQNPWIQVNQLGYGVGFYFDILKNDDMGTLVLPRGGEIRGRVIGADGSAIADCDVLAFSMWMLRWRTRADASGNYFLSGLPGEETMKAFTQRKNKTYNKLWSTVDIYARKDPDQSLADVPTYQIIPQDGKTLTAPDLIFGITAGVSGKLIPAKLSPPLQGLMVRLDYDWGKMVEADADGNFSFPSVPAGKHKLTVYLPTNLRYDRGIGRTDVELQAQQKLEEIQIQLDDLAEARVQMLDIQGNTLEGITAGATWNRDGSGGWTEGTRSGPDGWAVLYLYPGGAQYIRGMDMESRTLVSDGLIEVTPKPGEVIDNLRLTMVAAAKMSFDVVDERQQPVKDKTLQATISYADGTQRVERIKTDAIGRVEIQNVTPGAVKLSIDTQPQEFTGATDSLTEIKPGKTKDLGVLTLKPVTFYKITGRLAGSPTFKNLEGFKIRLDLKEWQPMVPTDNQGNFTIEKATTGKHRLIAYLPFNLRTDRGVGHAEIEVKEGDLQNVVLPLETLATINLKIQDPTGKPLQGISAAAWWTEDHSGVFTEGSKSDKDGCATLYLYPDEQQYLGAHDWESRYTLKEHHVLTLKPGEVKEYTVLMQPAVR